MFPLSQAGRDLHRRRNKPDRKGTQRTEYTLTVGQVVPSITRTPRAHDPEDRGFQLTVSLFTSVNQLPRPPRFPFCPRPLVFASCAIWVHQVGVRKESGRHPVKFCLVRYSESRGVETEEERQKSFTGGH